MKCQLSGNNARIIARAIQSLSKFGTELFIQTKDNEMQFRSWNASQSAVCTFKFHANFFESLIVGGDNENYWKVSMKTCLTVFRKMKQVEHCEMCISLAKSKLKVKFDCRLETIKNTKISIVEEDRITAAVTIDDTLNEIRGSQKMFNEVIGYFGQVDEITLEAHNDCLTIKNYIEGSIINEKFMRSQLKLTPDEFELYSIKKVTSVTFCMKEFRSFLHFAECVKESIVIKFNTAGSPIFLNITHSGIDCVLVMATISLDDISFNEHNNDGPSSSFIEPNDTSYRLRKRSAAPTTIERRGSNKTRKVLSENTTLSNSSLSGLSGLAASCDMENSVATVTERTMETAQPPADNLEEPAPMASSDPFIFFCDTGERNSNTAGDESHRAPSPTNQQSKDPPLRSIFSRCFEMTYVTKEPSPSSQNYVDASDED